MTIGHEFSMPPLLSGLDYMARATPHHHHHHQLRQCVTFGALFFILFKTSAVYLSLVVPGPPKRKGKKAKGFLLKKKNKIKYIIFYFASQWIFCFGRKSQENNNTTR